MNSLIIVTIFAVMATYISFNSCQPVDRDELKKTVNELITSCREETGASMSDLETLASHKMPESHEGKCLMECVFAKTNIMKNGKFNKAGLVEGFSALAGNDEKKLKLVEELGTKCEKELGKGVEDKCQNAKLLVDCVLQHKNIHDLEIHSTLNK